MATVPKRGKNTLEYSAVARMPQSIRVLKGVIMSTDAMFVRFQSPRPHTSRYMERVIAWTNIIALTGEVGGQGELVFFDSSDLVKREGAIDTLANGFIQVTGVDKLGNRQITTFNPAHTAITALDLEPPAAAPPKKQKAAPKTDGKKVAPKVAPKPPVKK